MTLKQKYLHDSWGGWRYIWIYGLDKDDASIHEIYKLSGDKVSWTSNPVSPGPCKMMLKDLVRMIDDDLFFTEDELMEHNRSLE
jgi:hypothetical protein